MLISYIVIPAIVLAFMLAGKWFTEHGMEWYRTLIVPQFTPPRWYFSAVWSVLFFLTVLSIIFWWQSPLQTWPQFIFIGALFILNGCLKVLWSYLFFYRRFIGLAVVDCGAVALSVALLIYFLWPVSTPSALLLIPYLTWTLFATYLNLAIWWRN